MDCNEAGNTSEPQQVRQMQGSPAPSSLKSALSRSESAGIDLQGSIIEAEHSGSQITELLNTPGEHAQQCSAAPPEIQQMTGSILCHAFADGFRVANFYLVPCL
jgi:hypothetical protein